MLPRILPFLFALISANALAYQFPSELFEYMDNAKVVAFVDEDDIGKTQNWAPFESEPPLSLTEALKAIEAQVANDPEMKDAVLSGVELKPVPRHEGYWNYLVKMNTIKDDKPEPHYFIVLMDGKIVSGLNEPESFK